MTAPAGEGLPTPYVDPDLSWIDVAVRADSPGDEIIIGHSDGWKEFNLDLPYLCDNVEDYAIPEVSGLYRWSGYKIGSWGEGDAIVLKGGTWTPYALPATPPEPSSEVVGLLRQEIERQCSIGAGTFTIDDGWAQSGLWQVNADLDPRGLAEALASRQPTPAPADDAEVQERTYRSLLRRVLTDVDQRGAALNQTLIDDVREMLAASPKAPSVAIDDLETEIADAIDDSLDMDWTGNIGARAVMKLLRDKGMVA